MNTESKGFAEQIVDKCIQNPKYAFWVVPLGLVLLIWGISDARYYASMAKRPTRLMNEASIVSKPNDRGFVIPHIVGQSDGEEISIPVGSKSADKLELESEIEFVETSENSGKYLLRSSVDSQNSAIYFELGGLPFNFIAILGLVIVVVATLWGVIAKPKLSDGSVDSPLNSRHATDSMEEK